MFTEGLMNTEDKQKALSNALAQIEKTYGKGSVMKLGDSSAAMNVETVPTGALSLDLALGLGGIPKGRVIEIFGPESSGKTTVALHMVAEVQKRGGIAGFIDAEHALDPVYAKNIGVDIDNLYISQPDNGEQALEITDTMVRSGAVDIIIIDSVAALVPKTEIDGEMGDTHVGLQARLMSQGLRKLTGIMSKGNCTVIFINQLRDKIGIMFGNPETTTGGKALKFYATIRIDVRKGEPIKANNEQIGNQIKVKIIKNKIAPPFKTAVFDIIYGKGISKESDILDLAVNSSIVDKSGAWYSYNSVKIGQGRENAKQYLKENPDICFEIENRIRQLNGLELLSKAQDIDSKTGDMTNSDTKEPDDGKTAEKSKGKKAAKKSSEKSDELSLQAESEDGFKNSASTEDIYSSGVQEPDGMNKKSYTNKPEDSPSYEIDEDGGYEPDTSDYED